VDASSDAVRCVALPVAGEHALVPSALVAEIFAVGELTPPASGPSWLLGSVFWRGLNLPVISFETAMGGERAAVGERAKSVVLRAVGESDALRYYAVLVQDIPRQVLASQRTVQAAPASGREAEFVQCELRVEGAPGFIPDIDALESALIASSAAWRRDGGEVSAVGGD